MGGPMPPASGGARPPLAKRRVVTLLRRAPSSPPRAEAPLQRRPAPVGARQTVLSTDVAERQRKRLRAEEPLGRPPGEPALLEESGAEESPSPARRRWTTRRSEQGAARPAPPLAAALRERQRALHRQGSHQRGLRALLGQEGILERLSVQSTTRRNYLMQLERFFAFAKRAGAELATHVHLDRALVDYCDDCYLDGKTVAVGHNLMAALECLHVDLLRNGVLPLPRFRRCLRGWRRLAPGRSRLPAPEEHALAVAGHLLSAGRRSMALLVLVSFSTYMRPGEARGLMAADLVQPVAAGPASMQQWVLVLCPWERGVPTKPGRFDETAALDDARLPYLGPCLATQARARLAQAARAGARGDVSMREFGPRELLLEWQRAVSALRLEFSLECMYQLRHGGASRDTLMQLRPQPAIQRRGRWTVEKSMRVYAKPGRLQQLLNRTPPSLLRYSEQVRLHFGRWFHDGGCPRPPSSASLSSASTVGRGPSRRPPPGPGRPLL